LRLLPLDRVRLLESPFRRALAVDARYVLTLDPDRLLAPFRRAAGLPLRAPSYGNWEDSGLDGHTAGHYLSALSFLWAATDDGPDRTALRARLEGVVAELAACQAAQPGGYVGGVPGGRELFESLAADGKAAVGRLGSDAHWVPWYNLHKTFQGLIDAFVTTGLASALRVVEGLAQWWVGIAEHVDDETFEAMLDIEFGGMNDAFAQLHALTGRPEYAVQAQRFAHRAILEPLLRGEDALTGLHANTQIPKAVGYASTARATGDDSYLRAAETFWRTVVEHRTVAIGGNSVREHFHDAGDFGPMIDDREGPEFCNTYNMLKLTRALAERALRPEHLDFAERALFNHVLGSQHPERGGFVYFTSMRPRHYRVYSQAPLGFWCCVGTGMEAQARYGEWVFGWEGAALAVNVYLPAEADVPEVGGRVRVDAGLPVAEEVTVTLELAAPQTFALRLRVPGWAGELADLRVGAKPVSGAAVPGAVVLERTWMPGDVVSFRLPITVRTEPLPGRPLGGTAGGSRAGVAHGSGWQAYLAGPSVLAARAGERHLDGICADDSRMGHVARGPLLPYADLTIVRLGTASCTQDGASVVLRGEDAGGPSGQVTLEPFAGIHDARYTVYWPVADDAADAAERRDDLARHDRGLALDAATVDAITFGEQQPESDHGARTSGARVVVARGGRWRVTEGRLSARLAAEGAHVLRVRYLTGDAPTAVRVLVDGEPVAEESFDGGDEVLEVEYPIADVLDRRGRPRVVAVSFEAADGVSTPGVGDVRVRR